MNNKKKIIKTTYGEKDAQLIDELLGKPNNFDIQKITLSIVNKDKFQSFEIKNKDILQFGGVIGFKSLVIRMHNQEASKKIETFFASGINDDSLGIRVEATKNNTTYYFIFWVNAISRNKNNIFAHFTDTLILF